MAGYIQINLKELLRYAGEDETKNILSSYLCPLNKDVDSFLKHKAVEFSKQGIAATFLVFASYKKDYVLVGYFTLATKIIAVYRTGLSKAMQKRIRKFAQYDSGFKRYHLAASLIGQLGKNYQNNYNNLITGDELLKLACEKVKEIQVNIGGRFVYLECEDKGKLIDFYSDNGFVRFGNRALDRDEIGVMEGRYLVQMLKYLGS